MNKPKLVSITFAEDKRKNHVFNFYENGELVMTQACPGRDTLDHKQTAEALSDWFSEEAEDE